MPGGLILMGVIGRAHGVRGHVRVTSHTGDPAALTGYGPLSAAGGRLFSLSWVGDGIAEVADITGGHAVKIADRGTAERLTNTQLFIARDQLPPPEADEYYLADLIGLTARDADGAAAGVVVAVHDHGAGPILEIASDGAAPVLLPFTRACVPDVSIRDGFVTIAPPAEVDVPETKDAAA